MGDDHSQATLEVWNQSFKTALAVNEYSEEPLRSWLTRSLEDRKKAMVDYLHGQKDALYLYHQELKKDKRDVLGRDDVEADMESPAASSRFIPPEVGIENRIAYLYLFSHIAQFTRKPLPTEVFQKLVKDLSAVKTCSGCGVFFLSLDARKKYCSKECQRNTTSKPDDKSPYRMAYRTVFMKFKRLLQKGVSVPKAVELIEREEPYAGLIQQFNIPVKEWGRKGGR